MYCAAALASLTAVGSAAVLGHAGLFWLGSSILMDAAGGLFALYLVVLVGLLVIGRAMRIAARARSTPSG